MLVYQGGLPEGKLILQGNPIQNVHRKNGEANGMQMGYISRQTHKRTGQMGLSENRVYSQ